MCVYLYIHNKYTQYTHIYIYILCKQKLLFWMRLIAINRLTALIIINFYFYFIINFNNEFYYYLFKYIIIINELMWCQLLAFCCTCNHSWFQMNPVFVGQLWVRRCMFSSISTNEFMKIGVRAQFSLRWINVFQIWPVELFGSCLLVCVFVIWVWSESVFWLDVMSIWVALGQRRGVLFGLW